MTAPRADDAVTLADAAQILGVDVQQLVGRPVALGIARRRPHLTPATRIPRRRLPSVAFALDLQRREPAGPRYYAIEPVTQDATPMLNPPGLLSFGAAASLLDVRLDQVASMAAAGVLEHRTFCLKHYVTLASVEALYRHSTASHAR